MSWNRAATSHMPKLNHRMLEFSWNAVYTIGASSQTVWKELISRGISSLLHQKLFKVFGPRKCYPRCVSSLLVPMSLNPKKHQRIPKALQTISVSCNQLQRSAAWSFYRGNSMSKGSHSFGEICTVGDAILMSPGILRIGVVTSKDGTEALDRFPCPLLSTDLPHFAVFTNQSTTVAWHLKPLVNLAFQMKAAASPSNLDGSSLGLLLLGTLSIHQKDGWWTSTLWKPLMRSSMNGLLDLPLTTPPLAELLSTKKQHPPVSQFCLPLPSHQDHGEQLNLANPVIPRQVLP